MKHRSIHWRVFIPVTLIMLVLVFAAHAQSGSGWTAQYFNNPSLLGTPVFTETAPSGINFNWGLGSPNPVVPVDQFSARFSSVQSFNQGTYEFVVTSDDGIRLIIDNVLVIDQFIGRPLTTDRVQVALTAGVHTITLEYLETIDTAAVQLQWFQVSGVTPTSPFPGGGIIVTPFGTPAVATPGYTGPLATVSGVRGLALRTGPYTGASFITTLPGDTSYPVLARNQDEGIYNWYYLQVGDRFGWASGRYLQLNVPFESLPLRGSIFDEIDGAPNRNAIAIPRAVMHLRLRPSTRTPIIGRVPWGQTVELIGRTVQAGENRWLQVRYEGMVGWISAPWVTIQGEIFSVPIR